MRRPVFSMFELVNSIPGPLRRLRGLRRVEQRLQKQGLPSAREIFLPVPSLEMVKAARSLVARFMAEVAKKDSVPVAIWLRRRVKFYVKSV